MNVDEKRLSDVLERTGGESSESCLVCVSEDGRAESVLSFGQARAALRTHRQWLNGLVVGHTVPTREQYKTDTATTAPSTTVVVAFLSGNVADFFLSALACSDVCLSRQRVVPALLNTRWTSTEMAKTLQSSSQMDQAIVLYGPGFRERAAALVDLLQQPACCQPIPEFSSSTISHLSQQDLPPSKAVESTSVVENDESNDDALILFTSGTTSGAKGVRLSHRALLLQARAKMGHPCCFASDSVVNASTVPFFHVGGLTNLLATWLAGGTLVLPSSQRRMMVSGFDPEFVLAALNLKHPSSWSCNTLVVVPAMIHALRQKLASSSPNATFEKVQLVLIGGQSASPLTLKWLRHTFPHARLIQTYACTEGASSLTYHNVTTAEVLSKSIAGDCVGHPPPHVELALLEMDENGAVGDRRTIRQQNHVGLVATRGPHLMSGYWNQTASTFDKGMWFVTNDLGAWDSRGRLWLCGRASDTIRTGGETVLAIEVERVLQQHPDIEEVAVFPLPDDQFGEMVACAIVCCSPTPQQQSRQSSGRDHTTNDCDVATIRNWCKQHGLGGYKCPKCVFVLSSLPRNGMGKVLKAVLQRKFVHQIRSKL